MNMADSPSFNKKPSTIGILEVVIVLALLGIVVQILRYGIAFPASLDVRAAQPEDRSDRDYLGFSSRNLKARNIAVVEGPFTLDTWLVAYLYLVRSGIKEAVTDLGVGRTHNVPNAPAVQKRRIRLALGEEAKAQGRLINLGCYGYSRGGGGSAETIWPFETKCARILEGPLHKGRAEIIYVEGDRECIVDRGMSIDDFAKTNPGNHVVVVVQLH